MIYTIFKRLFIEEKCKRELYNFQKAIYRREILCQHFLQRSVCIEANLTFYFLQIERIRGVGLRGLS